jgi:Icc protein
MKRRDALKYLATGATTGIASGATQLPTASADDQTTQPKRSARIAHLTDCHVYPGRRAAEGLAKAIRHVHTLDDSPDFILNGGDAINDALEEDRDSVETQWGLWKAAWKSHGALPVRHCLGNHDVWGWNKSHSKTTGSESGWGKQLALDQLQLERPYYAFDAGAWRCLVLDSMTIDEETAYRGELDNAQFAWLDQQLKSTPREMPIVVISHIPILTVGSVAFTPELRKHPQASKMLSHRDGFEILNLLRQHPNVKLCLSGHTHQTERIKFGDVEFVNSGAVCGFWWKGNFNHTDEGYNLVDLFDDGTYATQYVSYGWEAQS